MMKKPSIQQLTRKKNRMTTLINSALKENAELRDSSRTDMDDFDADFDLAADKKVVKNKNKDLGKKRGPRKQQYREDIERGIKTKLIERIKATNDNWLEDNNWLIERNELDQEISQDKIPFRITKSSFDPFDY